VSVETVAVLDRVTYTYPDRPRPALRDVSLQLHPAEVVLLVGGSGSGKSTLLRALNGLVPHFHGGTFAGSVRIDGLDTRTTPPRELAGHVGLVFQEPENQAVMATVDHEIAFGLENLGLPHEAISRLVEESLISLGLSRLRHAELGTLSGGELQKVALAAVLSMQPHLLLLDEPTSQLDPVSSEELLAAVRRLSEDTGATIILAEHRVERCLHLATRVLYMENGVVTIDAEPQEFARWAVVHRRELLPPVARLFAARINGGTERADDAVDREGSGQAIQDPAAPARHGPGSGSA
jgi:energy-coupling factor transport system ATP-binding protein